MDEKNEKDFTLSQDITEVQTDQKPTRQLKKQSKKQIEEKSATRTKRQNDGDSITKRVSKKLDKHRIHPYRNLDRIIFVFFGFWCGALAICVTHGHPISSVLSTLAAFATFLVSIIVKPGEFSPYIRDIIAEYMGKSNSKLVRDASKSLR